MTKILTSEWIASVLSGVTVEIITFPILGILAILGFKFRQSITFSLKLFWARFFLSKNETKRTKEITQRLLLNNLDDCQIALTQTLRAKAYIADTKFDTAIEAATDAIEHKKYLGDAYIVRGRAYSLKGEYDNAKSDFDEAEKYIITNKKDTINLYTNRGFVYYSKSDYNLAITDFSKTIELQPHNSFARINRAVLYDLQGNLDGAIIDCIMVLNTANTVRILLISTALEVLRTIHKENTILPFPTTMNLYAVNSNLQKHIAIEVLHISTKTSGINLYQILMKQYTSNLILQRHIVIVAPHILKKKNLTKQ